LVVGNEKRRLRNQSPLFDSCVAGLKVGKFEGWNVLTCELVNL
jgi:hypothetical protein